MSNNTRVQLKKGEVFGRLKIIKEAERAAPDSRGQRHRQFLLLCECGKKTTVKMGNLRGGLVRSCGCLVRELASVTGKENASFKHGLSRTKKYKRYNNLLATAESQGTFVDKSSLTIEALDELCSQKINSGELKTISFHRKDRRKPFSIDNILLMPRGGVFGRDRSAYVVDGKPYRTLQQVADVEGCSREWIRQKFANRVTGYRKEPYTNHFN